jgi:predicted MFS family arabinose efflux permease
MGRALRHRSFRIYASTHFVSAVAYWMQRIGIGWLTWQMTHEGFWLGIVAAAEALPIVVIAPFAGAVADRVNRLRMFRRMQFANLAIDVALAALVLTGHVTAPLMAGLILLGGVCNGLLLPLRLTIGPNLVPREDIPAAISLHSVSFQCSVFVGPALAGIVIAHFGVEWTFVINCLSYVLFIGALYMMRMNRDEHVTGKRTSVLTDTWEGVRYVLRHRGVAPLLLLVASFAIFTRPYLDLMPGLADAVFERGAAGLSALVSAAGVGGIAAGLWVAHYGRTAHMIRIVLTAVLALTIALFVFATTHWFALALLCVVVVSGMLTIASTGSQMLIQGSVEGAMRGRVMSLYGITWRGAPALGALIMGALASAFGLQAPLAAGAVMCLLAWAMVQPKRRALQEELEGAKPPA